MRNKIYRSLGIIIFLCFDVMTCLSQDIMMHTQGIMKQEFFNPAYNSFKDYTSISLLNKNQWMGATEGTPKSYALNAYVPIDLSGLGVGLTAITEEIGLRNKVAFTFNLSHNVKIGKYNYLAFGYGVGLQNSSIDMKRINTYTDSYINNNDLSSTDVNFSLGLFYFGRSYYAGLSSNVLVSGTSDGEKMFPGLDMTAGYVHVYSDFLLIKPEMVLKYYPVKEYYSNGSSQSVSYSRPILDIGFNAFLSKRLWLGTSYRVDQACTFSTDIIVKSTLKVGYTFDLGIGSGFNQFNSQEIRLMWNLIPRRALKGYARNIRYRNAPVRNIYR